ncbi:hypothetical protein LINPERHAP1_LOCUS40050 [Linum perenne]
MVSPVNSSNNTRTSSIISRPSRNSSRLASPTLGQRLSPKFCPPDSNPTCRCSSRNSSQPSQELDQYRTT